MLSVNSCPSFFSTKLSPLLLDIRMFAGFVTLSLSFSFLLMLADLQLEEVDRPALPQLNVPLKN
jgi:hypothetical protein